MPKATLIRPLEVNTCFGCGEENPIGLKLSFHWDGASATTILVTRKEFEGWPGIIHGGIVFTLLDEAMAWVSRFLDMDTLTVRSDVRFRRPLRVGDEVILTGMVVKQTRKVLDAKSTITLKDGTLIAEGTATMLVMENLSNFMKMVEGGVIWDLDGVLVDTASQHYAAWRDTLVRRGINFSYEDFRQTFGMRNEEIIKKILGDSISKKEMKTIASEKEKAFRGQINGNLESLPGVKKLLKELKDKRYRMALATSAPKKNVIAILEALQISEYFEAIVTGDDVTEGKPNPEVFVKAAEKLGAPTANCLVFEDSIAGIQAAKGAGMKCIAVSTSHHAEKLCQADVVVESLEEVNVVKIQGLLKNK